MPLQIFSKNIAIGIILLVAAKYLTFPKQATVKLILYENIIVI